MSKITICEGNIKWTSKGNTVLHAFDGDISFSAGECNIWSGEQGNETGEYIADAVGRQNEKFIACIDFYRSREHSEGKYGKLDTQYNGEFGFDRFDSKVCAEGLFSEYEKIRTVLTSENTYGKEKVYLCPYLSIWPPEIKVDGKTIKKKNEVTLFVKANKATDISKKNERATKATIVFSLEGENLKNEIVISPNKLDLEIGKEAKPISIKCNAPFKKDIKLIAKSVDEGQVLGQLIIKANAVVYQTTLQPIEIIFGSANKDIANDLPTTIDNRFFEKLVEYLNTKSLNQAYIHLTLASTIKQVTFSKQEFEIKGLFYTKDGDTYLKMGANDGNDELNNDKDKLNKKKDQSKALEYNNLVESRYAARLKNLQNEQNQKERVDKKKQIFINEFKKYYKYERGDKLKRVRKYHSKKMVKTIWEKENIKALFEEWKKEEEAYLQLKSNSISLDKNGQLHAFFTKDILTAGNPDRKTLAYSAPASGVSHIFKEAFINADEEAYATIAHELGHALGLEHTFDKKEILLQSSIINSLETEKQYLESLLIFSKKINVNIEDAKLLKSLKTRYNQIESIKGASNISLKTFQNVIEDTINLENRTIINGKLDKKEVITIENRIDLLKKEIEIEKKKIDEEIKGNKKELEGGRNEKKIEYSKIKEQSTTLENFMDYPQYENSIEYNKNFLRKTFYQWQWKKMQETGFSNSFLKTISILIFFSVFLSCKSLYSIQYQYYVYESEKKNEQGLPMQYYALLYNDPHFIKLQFSDYTNCDSGTIIEISTTEKDAFFFWIDSSLTTNVSLVQDTIFRKLYFVEDQKATLRFKYSKQQFYELSRKIIDESDDYILKENFNTFCLWFPPEMKRVKKIDESKFPKRSMKVMKKFFNK
ncbi:hypothetical protein [uncultured Capnocytophaga sp.]|uniref:hypothetical protein n=1 Tax=uncultured Capnocytophaga sp. TaxID=159273 RepID=UPI002606CD41|nr:hypothetical protein [uncultured Capnocytophaga sp.]